jgi:hypothetical protein
MQNVPPGAIKLFPPEMFKTLLNHEVNKSRRYGDSLTLVDLLVEIDPIHAEARHSAEILTMNALSLHLRVTDIACRRDHDFLILMPSTSTPGARTACERLRRLMTSEYETDSGMSFRVSTFIGMATLPIDHSITSDELAQNALQALQHVQANRLTSVIAFSEIPK